MESVPTDWQLDCTTIKQRGALLFQTGQWSDCTFVVATDELNQDVVFGHKVILAMASPVFEVMFYGVMAQSNEPVRIVDVQLDIFKALLEYIYTDNINISTIDKACELFYGAKKYMLPHLVKKCTEYLSSNLNTRNVCRVYEFARLMEENDLMESCIVIIKKKTKEVLWDEGFKDLELDSVVTIFSLNNLNIDSELDLFEAALRYATKMEKMNVENTTPPTEGPSFDETPQKSLQHSTLQVDKIDSRTENSPDVMDAVGATKQKDKPLDTKEKLSIRSVLKKIRFLTLYPQQFVAGPARSQLLSESETLHILMHIVDANNDVPFPPGFSSSKLPRQRNNMIHRPCGRNPYYF